MRPQLVAALLAAQLVSIICVSPVYGFGCHTGCHCIWRNGKMTATCMELQLESLPTDLDEGEFPCQVFERIVVLFSMVEKKSSGLNFFGADVET